MGSEGAGSETCQCTTDAAEGHLDKSVLNLVSVYAPQAGRSMEEKEDFYVSLLKTILNRY